MLVMDFTNDSSFTALLCLVSRRLKLISVSNSDCAMLRQTIGDIPRSHPRLREGITLSLTSPILPMLAGCR